MHCAHLTLMKFPDMYLRVDILAARNEAITKTFAPLYIMSLAHLMSRTTRREPGWDDAAGRRRNS